MRADDHDEPVRVRPARERPGREAELAGEPDRDQASAWRVVDGALRIVEAVGAPDLLERVGERLDPAADLPRPVDVACPVQHLDLDLPRLRQRGGLRYDRVD